MFCSNSGRSRRPSDLGAVCWRSGGEEDGGGPSTVIGYGSENQGTDKVHGAPLGDKDTANAKKRLGFDPEAKFNVPEAVRATAPFTRLPDGHPCG